MEKTKVNIRLIMGVNCEEHGDDVGGLEMHLVERKRKIYVCYMCLWEQVEVDLKRWKELGECGEILKRIGKGGPERE